MLLTNPHIVKVLILSNTDQTLTAQEREESDITRAINLALYGPAFNQ